MAQLLLERDTLAVLVSESLFELGDHSEENPGRAPEQLGSLGTTLGTTALLSCSTIG